jgi:hypothetical protein
LPLPWRAGQEFSCGGARVSQSLVAATGKAAAQQIFIGSEPFSIDLYELPLGDYDMVLGVQWLGTLGPLL